MQKPIVGANFLVSCFAKIITRIASLIWAAVMLVGLGLFADCVAGSARVANAQGVHLAPDTSAVSGQWRLDIARGRIGNRGAITVETLTINEVNGSLSGSLETPQGNKLVRDLVFHDGRLSFNVATAAPGEELSLRERAWVGPTLYYDAELRNGYLEGFMRAYFGAAELQGVKTGSGVTPPEVSQPAFATATPGGEAFSSLREETFSIGGQTHTVQIYRSNLLAAVLGLGPGESDVSVEFVLVPGGSFLMGSSPEVQEEMVEAGRRRALLEDEAPQRRVNVAPFLIARTELTQELWRRLAHLAGLERNPSFFAGAGDRAPVEQVSWNQAQLWLMGVNSVYDVDLRLPSEAEWEYANRAGTTAPFYNGGFPAGSRGSPQLDPIAWYLGTSEADYPGAISTASSVIYAPGPFERLGTQPVAQKQPNAFGLYDTLGNVFEWCQDLSRENYDGAPLDGEEWRGGNWVSGTLFNGPMTDQGPFTTVKDPSYVPGRVRRGGSWRNVAQNTRAAVRSFRGPNFSDANSGLRLALSVPADLPPRESLSQ